MISALKQTKVKVSYQLIYALIAVVAAVALPQLVHVAGAQAGLGSKLGEALLPMHLPVIFIGLLAGPYAGAVAGLLSPIVSNLLTGMPAPIVLPFIICETTAYGIVAGLLKNAKLNSFVKVVGVQVAGRAVRAIATLVGVYAFGSKIAVASIYTSILVGILGIVIQWAVLPSTIFAVNKKLGR